jgi:hypothetical protein
VGLVLAVEGCDSSVKKGNGENTLLTKKQAKSWLAQRLAALGCIQRQSFLLNILYQKIRLLSRGFPHAQPLLEGTPRSQAPPLGGTQVVFEHTVGFSRQ